MHVGLGIWGGGGAGGGGDCLQCGVSGSAQSACLTEQRVCLAGSGVGSCPAVGRQPVHNDSSDESGVHDSYGV